MQHWRGATILLVGSLVLATALVPARAWVWSWGYPGLDNYCGAGNAMCVKACDYAVPGGYALGKCYDHCYRGTAVCDASRIPAPGRHRRHRADP